MRPTARASASRLLGRMCALPLTVGMLMSAALWSGAPGSADTDNVATLVAAVANANQKLYDLGAAVQSTQEGVNKAIVEVQNARDTATAAQRELEISRRGIDDANIAIAAAQKRFDTFAAATYVSGPSTSYVTAADPADVLQTASTAQTLSISSARSSAAHR